MEQQRPGWAKVVGILMIVFGAFGLLSSSQLIFTHKIMEMQQGMFESLGEIEGEEIDPADEAAMEMMEKMVDTPAWFETFCVAAGVLGIIIFAFVIFSGVQLLLVKKSAIKFFYGAVIAAVSFCLLKAFAGAMGGMMTAMMVMGGSVFGFIVYIILGIVVVNADKSAFLDQEDAPLH